MEKVVTYVRVSAHSNSENAARNQTKKVNDFCEANGYEVSDATTVIGDRKLAFPMLMDLLKTAKEKGIHKVVMASTSRVVGTVDEIEKVQKAFEESGVVIETLDGSYVDGINAKLLVAESLAHMEQEMDEDQEQVFGQ